MKRVGIVGYGHLGKYLAKELDERGHEYQMELAFIWNRNKNVFQDWSSPSLVLDDLDQFRCFQPNLIVEVAHPDITRSHSRQFIDYCDYMIGSPTALADQHLEQLIRAASRGKHGVYVPNGALWGGQDIRSMSSRGLLEQLKIEMHFHPDALRLEEPLKSINDGVSGSPVVLYDGPVRQICKLAPNNVNTMACLAIAGESLGFDQTRGILISDPRLVDYHKIVIEAKGPISKTGRQFEVITERRSPSFPGRVTSSATLASFFNSLIGAGGDGPGIHLC